MASSKAEDQSWPRYAAVAALLVGAVFWLRGCSEPEVHTSTDIGVASLTGDEWVTSDVVTVKHSRTSDYDELTITFTVTPTTKPTTRNTPELAATLTVDDAAAASGDETVTCERFKTPIWSSFDGPSEVNLRCADVVGEPADVTRVRIYDASPSSGY